MSVTRSRVLNNAAVLTLCRLLATRGLSDTEIDRGVDYAVENAAGTLRQGFVLAMSRIQHSDAELAAGVRFTFPDEG